MIDLKVNYEIKNIEELEKVLTLLHKNEDLEINPKLNINTPVVKSTDDKVCKKCGRQLRAIPAGVNKLGKAYGSFTICDNCNPRMDNKFSNNIKATPDHIDCPNCGNLVPEIVGKNGSFYDCGTCGFKTDPRRKNFSNFINN